MPKPECFSCRRYDKSRNECAFEQWSYVNYRACMLGQKNYCEEVNHDVISDCADLLCDDQRDGTRENAVSRTRINQPIQGGQT